MNQDSFERKSTTAPPSNPAGEYIAELNPTSERRVELIAEIELLPARLRQLIAGLTSDQLDTKYKNWTVRQIVHHLADSHCHAYVRTKLALTEETPTIAPYDESRWSQLPDAVGLDVEASLRVLEGIHARWVTVLREMSPRRLRAMLRASRVQEDGPAGGGHRALRLARTTSQRNDRLVTR